jgi:cytochrome c biogenesis protein CcdA
MKRTAFVVVAVAAMIFGVVAYASAAGAPTSGTGTVGVTASVEAKLTLAVPGTVVFGMLDPGTAASPQTVSIEVQSNKTWTGSSTVTGDAVMGLTTALPTFGGNKGEDTLTDTYNVTVPWTTDPGNLTASVLYSATQ